MNGQPNRWFVRRSPFAPVLLVGWDVHEVAGLHINGFILESQSSRSLQQNDPFVLILVVPGVFRRDMAVRYDLFNAHVGGSQSSS